MIELHHVERAYRELSDEGWADQVLFDKSKEEMLINTWNRIVYGTQFLSLFQERLAFKALELSREGL